MTDCFSRTSFAMTAKNVGGEEKVAAKPPPSPFINPKIASLRGNTQNFGHNEEMTEIPKNESQISNKSQ